MVSGKIVGRTMFQQLDRSKGPWSVRNDGCLGVGTQGTSVRFLELEIQEVTGKGTPARAAKGTGVASLRDVARAKGWAPKEQANAVELDNIEWRYLSDMKEERATVGFFKFMKGKEIAATGLPYEGEHGLYAHADSKIRYSLGREGYRMLRGQVGVLNKAACIKFLIQDFQNNTLWESPEATWPAVTANPENFTFLIDISNLDGICLIATAANREFAHALWKDVQVGK